MANPNASKVMKTYWASKTSEERSAHARRAAIARQAGMTVEQRNEAMLKMRKAKKINS